MNLSQQYVGPSLLFVFRKRRGDSLFELIN